MEREDLNMGNIKVLKTIKDYSLIERYKESGEFFEYVVVKNLDQANGTWDSGDYFTPGTWNMSREINYSRAYDFLLYKSGVINHFKGELEEKLAKQAISYDRLVELATLFKDGLIEDDEANAKVYFTETCQMSSAEKDFFGIQDEYEVYEVEVEQKISRKIKVAVRKGMGEDEAIKEAEAVYEDIDLKYDERTEYGTCNSFPRYIGTYDYSDVDVENDIDELG